MQEKLQQPRTSKQMHNKNAFNYLSQLVINQQMLDTLTKLPDVQTLLNEIMQFEDYDSSKDYAAKFTALYENIEANHDAFADEVFHNFIISIYENHNSNLKDTYELIQDQVVNTSRTRPSPEHSVGGIFNWAPQDTLSVHPTREEGPDRRFQSVYGKDFTPQSRTNMPYVLQSSDNGQIMQLHFGTQARRIDDKEQVSKTFELYLQAKRAKDQEHCHLYINKLGLDRKQLPKSYRPKLYNWAIQLLEGVREYLLTKRLHEFADKQENLYLVTLPADKGNLAAHAYKTHNDEINLTAAQDVVLDVLNNQSDINHPNGRDIKDFYLGEKVENVLYAGKNRKDMHNEIVSRGADFLGLSERNTVSTAEQQALFFHTFAFEFTDELITSLQTGKNLKSWSCSCKDAIDRGKAQYAYYNLVKSFTTGGMTPWTFDQFNEALHGTATMVKGRGMNKHHKIVWNAVDVYVSNNYQTLVDDPSRQWLIEWRNLNCPIERVNDLLEDTIAKAHPQTSANSDANNYYTGVLKFVKENKTKDASQNQILLTALSTSMAIARTDYTVDENAQERHQHIIQQLPAENTKMAWLKGALTAFLGFISGNKETVKKGYDLMNGVSNLEELNQQVSPGYQNQ